MTKYSVCALAAASLMMWQSAWAADLDALELQASPILKNAVPGSPTLAAVTNAVKSLKTYSFRADMTQTRGGKTVDNAATFFVRTPNLLRVDIGGHGPKAGSHLVRNASGAIKFKGGPALFGITMNIEPDSRLLRLPSGQMVTECDYVSLMQDLERQVNSGLQVSAGTTPVAMKDVGEVIVLETHEAGGNAAAVTQRVCVDAKTKVPVRWVRFKDGQVDAVAKFDDVNVNANVPDDMFNI